MHNGKYLKNTKQGSDPGKIRKFPAKLEILVTWSKSYIFGKIKMISCVSEHGYQDEQKKLDQKDPIEVLLCAQLSKKIFLLMGKKLFYYLY